MWHDKDEVYYIMFEKVGRQQPCSTVMGHGARSRGAGLGPLQMVPLPAAEAAEAGWPRDALDTSHHAMKVP